MGRENCRVIAHVSMLPPADKLRLIQFLMGELAREEGVNLLEVDAEYPIWSPFDAFDAGATLSSALEQDKIVQPVQQPG